jgi:hypothetical protein
LPSNHGGARFAIEPNSNRVVAVGRWDAQKTDVNAFSAQLESYVNSIDGMQKTMASNRYDEPGKPQQKFDGGSAPPPGGAVFA